jgi:hypothetical protein
MGERTQYTFHYKTDSHDKILGVLKHREKKMITEIFGDTTWIARFSESHRNNNIAMEQVVVKLWSNVVSVYPMQKTKGHFENETWTKFDTRKGSPTQKYGGLLVGKTEQTLYIEMWSAGEFVIKESLELKTYDKPIITLRSLNCDEFNNKWRNSWLPQVEHEKSGKLIDFPLFLPVDWEQEWNVIEKTTFLTICR